jgi:predicted O-methyltransferase YrrM
MPFALNQRAPLQKRPTISSPLNAKRGHSVPPLQVQLMAKDYVAANLEAPVFDHLFPNMIEADKSVSTWPYFRREIDHPFRVDRRNPTVGFINRDEASILYTNARAFKGRRGIEIGAWRGWSTAHLIAAGLAPLHVVEPLLADTGWRSEFEQVVRGAGGASTTILVPEASPRAVMRLGEAGTRWSFAFIDGDHDGDAPTQDARACAPYLEATAMVVFHDLVSPHVAAGLRTLAAQGWNVMAYQTGQMMGVAWRGAVAPVRHKPDPTQHWEVPVHLDGIPVSGVVAA